MTMKITKQQQAIIEDLEALKNRTTSKEHLIFNYNYEAKNLNNDKGQIRILTKDYPQIVAKYKKVLEALTKE